MSIPNYRVLVSYDTAQQMFRARSPELEHCFGEGASRAEAIGHLEGEIQAQLKNMQEQGKSAPKAVDEQDWNGELLVHVSKFLHRDLAWQAKLEGIELSQLLAEILSGGVEARKQGTKHGRPARSNQDGNRAHGNHREGGDWGRHGGNYAGIEDRAHFIQYVRGMDGDSRGSDSSQRGKENKHRGGHHPNKSSHHHQKRKHGRRHGGGQHTSPTTEGQTESGSQGSGDSRPAQVSESTSET